MQDSERCCRFSVMPKSPMGQGIQPRSVAPHGSWEIGTNLSNRPLKAVAWVQIPSGLQVRIPCAARDSARFGERYRSRGFMLGPRLGRTGERVVFCDLTSRQPYVQCTYNDLETA